MNVHAVSGASHAKPIGQAAPKPPPKSDDHGDSHSSPVAVAKPPGVGAKVDVRA